MLKYDYLGAGDVQSPIAAFNIEIVKQSVDEKVISVVS